MSATAKKIRNRAGVITYNNPESANYWIVNSLWNWNLSFKEMTFWNKVLKKGYLSSKKGIIMFIMIQFTQTMQTLNIKKRKSSIKIIELWISVNNSVGLEN